MILKILHNKYFYLGLIILFAFWVRLYKIDNPVADWHSWRQADTAAVARNFYKDSFNPFYPKYDDMSGVSEPPIPNPNRYRFVEFPIYNSLVYFAYLLNGGVDEKLARLISVLFSLGSIAFIFFIVKKYFGEMSAIFSSFVFAFLPFNIFFSRVILPEPMLIFFSLGMLYFVDRWIFENTKLLFILSIIFTACAFLTKPAAGFYMLPLLYSYYLKEKTFWPIPRRYWFWLTASLLPFFAWRLWISQFPEGIPASNWLFNGNGIRFKPAFWKWIIADRFGREILTVTGTFLFFLGLLLRPVRGNWFLHILALSSFLYLIVFATGNVQHDYYQVIIIPALSIFLAEGFLSLCRGIPNFLPRIWTILLGLLFFSLTFYFGWSEVKGLYQINNYDIVEAGRFADKLLPKDAVVVAPYQGDTAFLYQTNRPGWPIVAMPIKDLIDTYKVHYYISVNYDTKTKWVMRKYTTMEENPKFVIVDLTKEKAGFDVSGDKEP